ncbi:MAG: large repetitive protein, partial [Campylobacterota bacterium]|nr:large repetitive protein [Campylobacterota bacterium]
SVTLSDTTNYALDGAGSVTLTAAGLALVNSGADLPAFTLTPNDGTVDGTPANVDPAVSAVNDAPISTNDSIIILEDINNSTNVYTITINDFGVYGDEEGNAISAVRIETLPSNGILYLDGVALNIDAIVLATDINSGKLTFNPTDHSDADSSFIFKVNDGLSWSSDSYTTTINIEAVADAPTLSITSSATITQEITLSNVTDTSSGFNVTAYLANGVVSTISTHTNPDGFGVTGVASGADSELGYLSGVGSEKIVVEFDQDITSVDVSFAWKNSTENATYTFYKDGIVVGEGTNSGGSDLIDPAVTLKPDSGMLFDMIVFSAPRLGDDYLINSIAYDKTVQNTSGVVVADENSSIALNISSALVDNDGSEVLSVMINDIPAGFMLSDGVNTFTADTSNISVNITNWSLSSLILTTPIIEATTIYTLNVIATATEYSNGSSASTILPIEVTVNNNPNLMILNDNISQVDEAALSVGTDSISTSETVSGNILNDDILPSGTILSSISIEGGNTVIDIAANIATVTTAEGNELIVNMLSGDYTYTLVNPVNHSILGNDIDTFTYTVTDATGVVASANLEVKITDDAPVINNTTPIFVSAPAVVDTNIIFTLDVSGSMDDIVTGTTTRFDIAKQALIDTINAYSKQGDVNVNLTLFNGGAVNLGWKNQIEILDYLSKLTMNHDTNTILYNGVTITDLTNVGTNYEAALAVTPTTYGTNLPAADKTVAYFISDGTPTVENNEGKDKKFNIGTDSESGWLDTPYVTDWTNFISANNIDLTVIGIGTNLSTEYLDIVQVQDAKTALIVSDATQLSDTITSNINVVEGSLYSLDSSSGINFGADGGHIYELVYNNVTYTYDSINPTQVIALSEGTMELDFETGNYIYTPVISSGNYISEEFNITIVDKDGDTYIDKLNINIINDTYVFDATSDIDTGVGYDILLVDSSIDFSALSNEIKNIEEIHLGEGVQNISLSLSDVISITDTDNDLYVTGDSVDSVSLKTTDNWVKSMTQTQLGFNEYTSTQDETVKLQIQDDVKVTIS